jgi:hypothetical protein
MTDVENRAAATVVLAIVETVEEIGEEGAPLGIMYSALQGVISYHSFVTAINALAKAGVIRVSNNCAYPSKVRRTQ